MPTVSVVVLGDVGRSPRMQYHALSLAKEKYKVNVIGYRGSESIESLSQHENVKFVYVADCPDFKSYLSGTLAYFLKALWQTVTLFWAVILAGFPDFVLVQNPPAMPSLFVCYLFSRIARAKFIIDWHNYAFTILSLSLGDAHKLVKFSKIFEFWLGQRSDANICVTRAMKDDLEKNYNIKAVTLYDRPPDHFQPIATEEKHKLLRRLGNELPLFVTGCQDNETVFTQENNGNVSLRDNRPGLLISSTSWTEDEDFSILLDALQSYEDARSSEKSLPSLIVAITGKGPLKEFYVSIIEKRKWKYVEVITPWLSAEDYPKFLACGDLGVCLHTSSSQLDLPMKVVDMFGCNLPVAAVKFKCLGELLVDQKNGFVFQTCEQLADQIQAWFTGFPDKMELSGLRSEISKNLASFRSHNWHENWLQNVKDLF